MLEKHSKEINLIEDKKIKGTYAISPIIVNGDTIGTVLIVSTEDFVDENDLKIVQIASKFLNTHLEQ